MTGAVLRPLKGRGRLKLASVRFHFRGFPPCRWLSRLFWCLSVIFFADVKGCQRMKMVFDINQLKVGVHSLPFSRFPALSVVVNAVLVLVNNFLQMSRDVKGEQLYLIEIS